MPVKRGSRTRGGAVARKRNYDDDYSYGPSSRGKKREISSISLDYGDREEEPEPPIDEEAAEKVAISYLKGLGRTRADGSQYSVTLCLSPAEMRAVDIAQVVAEMEVRWRMMDESLNLLVIDQFAILHSEDAQALAAAAGFVAYKLFRCQKRGYPPDVEKFHGYTLNQMVGTDFLAEQMTSLERAAVKYGVSLNYSRLASGFNFSPFTKVVIQGSLRNTVNFLVVFMELQLKHRTEHGTKSLYKSPMVHAPIIGTYGNPFTYSTQDANTTILQENIREILEYATPREEEDDSTPAEVLARRINHLLSHDLSSNDPDLRQQFMKFNIDIHLDIVGLIIGKNGANINEVRKQSNCQLKVMDSFTNHYANDRVTYEKNQKMANSHRQIQVSGKYDNVRVALYKLLELIHNEL
ncbi:hypothetical protein BABINDRAFT_158876 [Babjeviella inositovora NRRL Y-12698]|uniref:K Homology domain-containing protein n=1 Tax=Babjeviella inositovora NRRL Y-12698 TaxID=984486 RepID=A0A1E3QX63_9ASCO|nr:uncharacterized protein BABINDRAFT_158876 [Babjeviella inositovora NRRL Y-12698]ODQ82240.1 hypothetical protein BABINDRAFT_158876 [Babjeviella inositovora NRRL Y-12698]